MSPSLCSISSISLLSLVVATAGCGSSVDSDPQNEGGGGAGATTSTTVTSSTSSQGGGGQGQGGQGQGGQGQGGGANVCVPDPVDRVTMVARNDTGARLWFAGGGGLGVPSVDGGSAFCPCDAMGMCPGGGVASVSLYVGYLDPGDAVTGTWNGLLYDADQPAACSCEVGRTPGGGPLVARALAYSTATEGFEECDLSTGDACYVDEGIDPFAGGPTIEAVTQFDLPTDQVTVVFTAR